MIPAIAPTRQTERLTLRMPRLGDFAHRQAFCASDRAAWEGGPFSPPEAWRVFASEDGEWLLIDFGPVSVDEKAMGDYLGEVGIHQPAGHPEPELGWFVVEGADGKGYAAEAAKAVMVWAANSLGRDHVDNHIDPGNARSIALGLRLGGQIVDVPADDPTDVVIRHDLWGLA